MDIPGHRAHLQASIADVHPCSARHRRAGGNPPSGIRAGSFLLAGQWEICWEALRGKVQGSQEQAMEGVYSERATGMQRNSSSPSKTQLLGCNHPEGNLCCARLTGFPWAVNPVLAPSTAHGNALSLIARDALLPFGAR